MHVFHVAAETFQELQALPETLPRPWVPSSLDIVGPDDVRAAHPRVLPDALERLPGVTLQNQQGNPYQPDLSLRGFSASPVTGLPQGISVFLDGVRLNEPTVEEVNFDLIPLDDVDLIAPSLELGHVSETPAHTHARLHQGHLPTGE